MLRLNILPEGYIYPKENQPIWDLLRKRGNLVRLRTSLIISLQNIISRNNGVKLKVGDIKIFSEDRVASLLGRNEDLALAGKLDKECIDFLARQIKAIETVVEKKQELLEPYDRLLTEPGIGKILRLMVMLETGPISRFAKVGNYVSYCRRVSSKWISNEKNKGKVSKKSGNKGLAWAFSEATEIARRYDENARAYYNRKAQQTNRIVAHNALAHKLARADYYIMRDGVSFMPENCFV
jgi:transposase